MGLLAEFGSGRVGSSEGLILIFRFLKAFFVIRYFGAGSVISRFEMLKRRLELFFVATDFSVGIEDCLSVQIWYGFSN
jgi:hypothetical protein